MKKITIIIAYILISMQGSAQLLTENFDTALNWTVARMSGTSTDAGWTRRTVGSAPSCAPFEGAGMARFYSYNIATGNTFRLTSPAITFAGATYRVAFKMYRDSGYPTDADRIQVYYNTTDTTTGGTLLGTINRSTALAPIVAADGWYSYDFNLPAAATGTGYISFLATSAYGNNMFIDSVVVSQIQGNDAQMASINVPSIISNTANGNTTISGTFKNYGLNTINNLDLSWQIDSGTINTQSLTGLNLAPGAVYTYNHMTQWNATPGLYSLKVSVSADGDSTNNSLTKLVSVASNQTTRLPLYEKFSSSTCPPCATFNGTYFSPFYTTGTNGNDLGLISYQVNWPGTGDPYYTAEVGTRVGYYGVSGAPTLFVDSKDSTTYSTAGLQANLNTAKANPAFFAVSATKNLVGTNMTVNVDVLPYLTGAYKVHIAVVEKQTTGNVASNGETEFKNVLMKMMPNASGTTINCVYNVAQPTLTVTTDLTGLFIEDLADLEVIVFIQSTYDKGIMQSKKATQALSNNEFEAFSKVKLYPNPSNGIVRIKTESAIDLMVIDITGKVVYTMKDVNSETSIDLSSLQKGVYFVKMLSQNTEETHKIILK